ncbi:group II intron reverse transcriptase/maturase [Engelhardtia mirabilis]|uniref:RNA-directed DNA polymerase n=1 Tax=Engelhardtia mirabilis TaxID=2528011 RepID=A0A518BS81_9BACT|nr:Group II intron-encoded protein LtrA [Planctomycetes bacterium Pla133]QDV04159.1 Group II intron-encoded protein LtrA [Planctomycetes bacterium Pla86]
MEVAKPFQIPKKLVWEAYLRVKSSDGGPGVDGQAIEDFEVDLKDNLYRLWNRMSSGSYFPPPVKLVAIPKGDGGERRLGVPTVADRVAQNVVKTVLDEVVEPQFHPDSYGYRPGRSAHDAMARARTRCWQFDWVLDLDIRAFLDSLDHHLVMRAVRRYTSSRWVLLYVERWLKAPLQLEDGSLEERDSGTPQGGVISPVLANIFLHLAFDTWMAERHPDVPFERYADDVVIHCRTEAQAMQVRRAIVQRLAHCRLEAHPAKTKIVYCRDSNRRGPYPRVSFDFLGYTFRQRRAHNRGGQLFLSFSLGVSDKAAKAMRQEMRRCWRVARRTDKSLIDLANMFNPSMRSWIAYYGAFHRSALVPVFRPLNYALVRWAQRKYRKRFRRCGRQPWRWLAGIARRDPTLFAHWAILRTGMAER